MERPTQRTLIVLGALTASMTLASAVLLMLEPGPIAPISALRLTPVAGERNAGEALFDTDAPVTKDRYSHIVIYESGSQTGSAASLDKLHQKLGLGGLGYHFVIGNGSETDAGQIEFGYRWSHQLAGMHATGPYRKAVNQHAIGICLIANTDQAAPNQAQLRQLIWLIQQLQRRFDIPAEHVMFQADIDPKVRLGRYLPLSDIRMGLLTNVR